MFQNSSIHNRDQIVQSLMEGNQPDTEQQELDNIGTELQIKQAEAEIQKTLVPLFFSLPNEENQLAPLLSIVGITAIVSTLFTIVGHPYNPIKAGKGGFNLG